MSSSVCVSCTYVVSQRSPEKSDFDKTMEETIYWRKTGNEKAVAEIGKKLKAQSKAELASATNDAARLEAKNHMARALLLECGSLAKLQQWSQLAESAQELETLIPELGPRVAQFMPQAYKWHALALVVPGTDLNKGLEFAQKALDYRQTSKPINHELVEADLKFCAYCAFMKGERKKQREYLEKCLAEEIKVLQKDDQRLADTEERLCDASLDTGNPILDKRAADLAVNAIVIRKLSSSQESAFNLTGDYLRLARASKALKQNERAEGALQEASKLVKERYKESSKILAIPVMVTIYNLSNDEKLKREIGRDVDKTFDAAERYLTRSAARELSVYQSYIDLAIDQGDMKKAEQAFTRMKQLVEPNMSMSSVKGVVLRVQAKLAFKEGKFEEAEKAMDELIQLSAGFKDPAVRIPIYELQERIYAAQNKTAEQAEAHAIIKDLRNRI